MASTQRKFVVVADASNLIQREATATQKRVIVRLVRGDELVGDPNDPRIADLIRNKAVVPAAKYKSQRLTTRLVYNLSSTVSGDPVDDLVEDVTPVSAPAGVVDPGNLTASD